ncbi:MAG: ABC transporter permease, partial [bacterium]
GYRGRKLDATLMRLNDALTAFPSILLALVIIGILGPGKRFSLILALSLAFIPSFARVTRTAAASLRERNFVIAARLRGMRTPGILFLHVLPNCLDVLLPALTIGFNNAVLAEASMSYLGIGITPPEPSLGYMLSEAQSLLRTAPWYALFTGLAILLLILSVSLIGDGLRKLDGRER